MQPEIEVKFLNIDIENMRARLQAAGAELVQPMMLMRRVNIETPEMKAKYSWIRIRDEGRRCTMTFKQFNDPKGETIDNLQEIEVEVSSFEDTVQLLNHAGWDTKTYQEMKREVWALGSTEVVIDEWPWLNPMIEIEASSEAEIKQSSEVLGLDFGDCRSVNIDVVYKEQYEVMEGCRGVIDIPSVKFGDPVPAEFGVRK